jgi:peptidoglycan/LPS O-acetylase OafA/YrhL
MSNTVPRLHALTGLRFVAAAGIVLCHSAWFGVIDPRFYELFNLGRFVDLFFILSGFILTYVYPRLETAGDRGRFLLARFARLWPAHALGLLLMVLLFHPPTAPVPGIGPRTLAVINLAMVHSWVPVSNLYFSYNGPSWSIATEFGFYICFLFLIRRWERTWHVKLLLAWVLALLPRVCLVWLPAGEVPGTALTVAGLNFHPLVRLFEFTLGMTAALLWRNVSPRLRVGRSLGTLLELAALALAGADMYTPLSYAFAAKLIPWIGAFGVRLESHLPFALLILVLANEWGWVSRMLAAGPAVLLGEISYTVYILHAILARYYGEHQKAFAELPPWLVYGGYWLVLLVVCHFVWAGLERPVRLWLVGLWPKPVPDGARPNPVQAAGTGLSFWQRLAAPGRWLLAGEALALTCLLASVAAYATRPLGYRFINARTAEALAAQGEPAVRGARFGEHFVLRGAVLAGARLRLVWESCQKQDTNQCIAVHLLDRTGKILHGADYVRKLREATVTAGALWEERVDLPQPLLAGVTHIGICVTPNGGKAGPMPVAGAPCDWNGHRLLLALPAGASPSPESPPNKQETRHGGREARPTGT